MSNFIFSFESVEQVKGRRRGTLTQRWLFCHSPQDGQDGCMRRLCGMTRRLAMWPTKQRGGVDDEGLANKKEGEEEREENKVKMHVFFRSKTQERQRKEKKKQRHEHATEWEWGEVTFILSALAVPLSFCPVPFPPPLLRRTTLDP